MLWDFVADKFNQQFSFSPKTAKQIKLYYQNCLRKDLKNDMFLEEEKELFQILLIEKKLKLYQIAQQMNRTSESVKRYYYRAYLVQKNYEKKDIDSYQEYGIDPRFMTENDEFF
jgi:hypothetical protein